MSEAHENRRRMNSFWVRPKGQLLLAFTLGGGYMLIGLLMVSLLFSMEGFLQDLAGTNQINTQTALTLNSFIYLYVRIALALATIFAILNFAIALRMGHRIYGPIVALRAHVGRLIRKDYKSRVHTRGNDEFKDLASDLNALAESLDQSRNV